MEANKKKWVIIAVVCVALAAIIYWISSLVSCDSSASNKIEVVSEPYFSYRISGNRYSPAVRVTIKNKTNDTIKVEMTCTVYAKDGSVTTGLKSSYTSLVAGETVTLTATISYTYSPLNYSDICARFGKVEYKFY